MREVTAHLRFDREAVEAAEFFCSRFCYATIVAWWKDGAARVPQSHM